MFIKIQTINRGCNGCTKCCEGWLVGSAYGFGFNENKRCAFLNKGCSIYPIRPTNPCKTFECQWKKNKNLPEWLKPDQSNVIIVKRIIDKFECLFIVHTGKRIDQKVFDWAKEFSQLNTDNHIVVNDRTKFTFFSQNINFEKIAKKELNIGD